MIEIKICGITTIEDALVVYRSGAHALGFIFYDKSPRYISPEAAEVITRDLPDSIARVGVFVNAPLERAREIALFCRLTAIQLHGDETPGYCDDASFLPVIKAITPAGPIDLSALAPYHVHAFLVDARDRHRRGGTGKTSDWIAAATIAARYPLILSGGLDENNVIEGIRRVSPRAVDINSGVEDRPGKKNHEKISRIVALIRNFDHIEDASQKTHISAKHMFRNHTKEVTGDKNEHAS